MDILIINVFSLVEYAVSLSLVSYFLFSKLLINIVNKYPMLVL